MLNFLLFPVLLHPRNKLTLFQAIDTWGLFVIAADISLIQLGER